MKRFYCVCFILLFEEAHMIDSYYYHGLSTIVRLMIKKTIQKRLKV